MKEIKNEVLKLRISATEKEKFKEYAEEHDMTLSELIRAAVVRYIALENKEEEEK